MLLSLDQISVFVLLKNKEHLTIKTLSSLEVKKYLHWLMIGKIIKF